MFWKPAVHQNRFLYVVAVHDSQSLLCSKAVIAVIARLGEELEHFAAAPLALSAANGAQLAASAVTGYDLCQM